MPTVCPHCGQPLPASKEEISPGFNVPPAEVKSPFDERYTAIRKEIESARKNLRNRSIGEKIMVLGEHQKHRLCRTVLHG
jgi:hypothetical protein